MYTFSRRSLNNLASCHPLLREVMHEAIKTYDFTVIEGYRGKEKQNKAFREGKSQLKYPQSKHNTFPCLAVDVMPYPDGFKASTEEWYKMATHILAAASRVGVGIEWGGHWKTLVDMPHFELKG